MAQGQGEVGHSPGIGLCTHCGSTQCRAKKEACRSRLQTGWMSPFCQGESLNGGVNPRLVTDVVRAAPTSNWPCGVALQPCEEPSAATPSILLMSSVCG